MALTKTYSLENARSERGKSAPFLYISTAISLAFVALPIFYLAKRAMAADLETLQLVIFRSKTIEVFITTLALATMVAALATLIGLALAWSLHNVALPAAKLLRALAILPMAIPSYVFTFCWLAVGWLPGGFLSAVFILTMSTAPYVTLAALAALRRIDFSQMDVAQTLGLDQFQIFRRVTLPQIASAIGAGSLLVALYALSDFGAVSLLGVDTFTRSIQNTYQGSFDRSSAAVLALMLVLVAALVISLENISRNRASVFTSSVTMTKSPNKITRRPIVIAATTFIASYILTALILPLAVLAVRFISRPTPIDFSSLFQAGLATVSVSLIGAALALALALPVSILAARRSRFGRMAERSVLLVNALPGIVLGLALVAFGSDFPIVYQTVGLLALSYSILFLARSVGTVRSAISRVPINLTEVAATLGQSKRGVFWRVTLPLAAPSVLTGGLLVFLSAMKELPATLMLRPTGFETLATEMWSNAAIFRFSQAAPYALVLVLIAAIPTFMISRPDKEINQIAISRGGEG